MTISATSTHLKISNQPYHPYDQSKLHREVKGMAASACGASLALSSQAGGCSRLFMRGVGFARPAAGTHLQLQTGSVSQIGNRSLQFSSLGMRSRIVGGRGSLIKTRSMAGEIFRIVPIVCGLVLVGVAVGFALLRIEAAIEESEQES